METTGVARLVGQKIHGAVHLMQLIAVTRDWWEVRRHRREGTFLPPVRLRNGFVLHHGKNDKVHSMGRRNTHRDRGEARETDSKDDRNTAGRAVEALEGRTVA